MNNNVHKRINLEIVETSVLENKMQKNASFLHTRKQILNQKKDDHES